MKRNQSGFVLGVIIVVMVLGATAFFGLYAQNWLFQNQDQTRLTALHQLNDVKQQLLKYAQLQPELYLSDLKANTRTDKESKKYQAWGICRVRIWMEMALSRRRKPLVVILAIFPMIRPVLCMVFCPLALRHEISFSEAGAQTVFLCGG